MYIRSNTASYYLDKIIVLRFEKINDHDHLWQKCVNAVNSSVLDYINSYIIRDREKLKCFDQKFY